MSSDQAIQALSGWSTGYTYAQGKNTENEVKQGKNYYFSALAQVSQISQLSVVGKKISDSTLLSTTRKGAAVFFNVLPILSVPFCLCFAVSKHGCFPEKLNGRTEKAMNFLAEHLGDMLQVAMITGSIALIALGNLAYGGAALCALSYQAIDNKGYIPRKVSLFMETYMPTVALCGMLSSGILVNRVIAALTLPYHLFPSLTTYTYEKIDVLYKKYRGKPTDLTLEEINAPLQDRKNLEYAKIQEILEKDDRDFTVDPAHLSKWTHDNALKETDGDFNKLLKHFSSVNWRYDIVKGKLKTDERFLDVVSEKCNESDRKKITKDIDTYIEQLAKMEGIEKTAYVVNYITTEFTMLVKILNGEVRAKGLQRDVADAIHDCKYIIPHLDKLAAHLSEKRVDFEDILLQLAVEAGNYCARGIKGTMKNIVSTIVRESNQFDPVDHSEESDPNNYESQLRQALQNQRMSIVESAYKQLVDTIASSFPDAVTHDKHAFDIYHTLLSFGFAPLTNFEKREFSIEMFALWEVGYRHVLSLNIDQYKENLKDVFKEVGEVHFAPFLVNLIRSNTNLTQAQQNEFEENFVMESAGGIDKYQRLALVMLGILKCN